MNRENINDMAERLVYKLINESEFAKAVHMAVIEAYSKGRQDLRNEIELNKLALTKIDKESK